MEMFFDAEEEIKRKKTNYPGAGERSVSISSQYFSVNTQIRLPISLEKKRSYLNLVAETFEEPYIEAVRNLRQLETRHSPINKLQV